MNTIQIPDQVLERMRDAGERLKANRSRMSASAPGRLWRANERTEDMLIAEAGAILAEGVLPLAAGGGPWRFLRGVTMLNVSVDHDEHPVMDHIHTFSLPHHGRSTFKNSILLAMPYSGAMRKCGEASFDFTMKAYDDETHELTALRLPDVCSFYVAGATRAYLIGTRGGFFPGAGARQQQQEQAA